MSEIPDAAIEAAAEAMYLTHPDNIGWRREVEQCRDVFRREARAAVEAAMPAIREAIAQEIEAYADRGDPMTDHQRGWKAGTSDAARIVRGGTP